jgi:hypothetical protein
VIEGGKGKWLIWNSTRMLMSGRWGFTEPNNSKTYRRHTSARHNSGRKGPQHKKQHGIVSLGAKFTKFHEEIKNLMYSPPNAVIISKTSCDDTENGKMLWASSYDKAKG